MERFSKHLFCIIGLITSLFLSTSCKNDGDIGDIYGKWQLEGHESYINFEGKILQLQVVNAEKHELTSIWGWYEDRGDSLHLHFKLTDYVEGTSGMQGMNTTKILSTYFGIKLDAESDTQSYAYKIDSKKLLLHRGTDSWSFKHYGF